MVTEILARGHNADEYVDVAFAHEQNDICGETFLRLGQKALSLNAAHDDGLGQGGIPTKLAHKPFEQEVGSPHHGGHIAAERQNHDGGRIRGGIAVRRIKVGISQQDAGFGIH